MQFGSYFLGFDKEVFTEDLLMSVVVEAAVMLQHKPSLPPTLHEARVSPLM